MVFLFQETMIRKQPPTAVQFKPAESYSLDLSKAIRGNDGVTPVPQKTAKYLEYALKASGADVSKFTVKVSGKTLNEISSQPAINRLVREYNASADGEKVPEFEKLPQLSSKEVAASIKALLPDPKYEKIKNIVLTKN